jgi:mevalonate kinase
LLLTGEYFVLDGATALAVPVRFGQTLRVERTETPGRLSWTSIDADGEPWFRATFELPSFALLHGIDDKTAATLAAILRACQAQQPGFLSPQQGYAVQTQNDFPRRWGLGTSSTLIAALGRWSGADPYRVLFDTLGGSGYDIACAYAEGPVLYRLSGRSPEVKPVDFSPAFSDALYFVYLGKKQDSRAGIRRYRDQIAGDAGLVAAVSGLTERFRAAASLAELEAVVREHETLVGRILDLPRAKDLYFSDFWGEIKSLGAWGGDFVMASSAPGETETRAYFEAKGFETVLRWEDMVL